MTARPSPRTRPLVGQLLILLALSGGMLIGTFAVAFTVAGDLPLRGGATPAPTSYLSLASPSVSSAVAPHPSGASAPTSEHPLGAVHAPLFPPAHPLAVGNCTTTPVVPGCGFSAEPAPMGIADYGVSGYGNPTDYAYGTTMFLGYVSWTNAYIYSSGQKADFSVQLNVVLNFINDGQNYSYWIQNVPVPTDTTKNDIAMSYANNIWNFSCASSTCNLASGTGTVSGNGTNDGGVYIWPASANSGCAGGKTGTCDTLDGPSWFAVEVRTFLNPSGEPVVRFCYFDAKTALSCYDTVTFGFAHDVTTFRGFFVDGFSMNPTGLFEDAELDFGGPGNGASTDNTGPSDIQTSLDFWNGHNFQAVPSAWNAGDDTAEALGTDQSVFSNDGTGTPLTDQLNGTTREDFENPAYTTGQVGTLQLWAPGTNTGTVVVHVKDWNYTNGDATLTLVPGTYHVWVNSTSSTDMGMCTITAGATLNVSTSAPCSSSTGGTPTVTAPTASHTSIDVGQTVTFTTTASGGTGTYTSYTWTVSPSSGLSCTASTTTASTSCTASAAGSYKVSVTVTDSGSTTSSPATSSALPVYPDPTVAVPSASASSVSVGSTVTFTTTLGLAGSGGDSYAWTASSSSAGCTASTTTSYSCTPTNPGTFTATATVTDSNGGTGSNTSASVTVISTTPTVTAPTFAPASIDVGQKVTFTTTPSGGSGTYSTFSWTTSPATGLGCTATTTAASTVCTATTAGSYTVSVTVTDNAGHTSAAATSASYTVHALPTLSAPTFSLSSIDVGQASVTLTTTISGQGSGGDTLVWSFTPSSGLGCPSSGAASITCIPTSAASYTATATVTDSNGGSASATSAAFVVYAPPTVSTPSASPSTAVIGESISITSTLTSPGSGDDSYAWAASSNSLGCSSANALTTACTPTAAGSFTITLTATDSNGGTGTATSNSISVTVGGGLLVNAQATPNPVVQGSSTTFSVSVLETSGGSGTYTYSWRFGDLGTSISSSPTHVYLNSGTFDVVVFVNDSEGHTGSASFQVSVTPSEAQTSASNAWGSDWFWVLLLVIIAACVVAGVLSARRKGPEAVGMAAWDEGYGGAPPVGGYASADYAAAPAAVIGMGDVSPGPPAGGPVYMGSPVPLGHQTPRSSDEQAPAPGPRPAGVPHEDTAQESTAPAAEVAPTPTASPVTAPAAPTAPRLAPAVPATDTVAPSPTPAAPAAPAPVPAPTAPARPRATAPAYPPAPKVPTDRPLDEVAPDPFGPRLAPKKRPPSGGTQ